MSNCQTPANRRYLRRFFPAMIGYVVVMCAIGKARQIHALMWTIAPFFLLFFAADWLEANVF